MTVTYGGYLRLDDLLALQQPQSDPVEHDEMLFIVIHQVYELWFKQVLWEIDRAIALLDDDDVVRCQQTLKRVLTILKVLVAQMDVLETMTPLEFLSFRERLATASGFESQQFRQLETVLGGGQDHSLWAALLRHLRRQADIADHEVDDALVDLYRHDPVRAALLERFVDLDEGLQEWRYRHVKMVERTIGTKPGTGGSSGVDYLRSTVSNVMYPPLWAIRSRL